MTENTDDTPYPIALLLVEGFAENMGRLVWDLGDDVFLDDIGQRCITRARARAYFDWQIADEALRRQQQERGAVETAATAAKGEVEAAAQAAKAAAHEKLFARYIADGGDPQGAAVGFFAWCQRESAAIDQQPLLAELAEREATARHVDEHGNVTIGGRR